MPWNLTGWLTTGCFLFTAGVCCAQLRPPPFAKAKDGAPAARLARAIGPSSTSGQPRGLTLDAARNGEQPADLDIGVYDTPTGHPWCGVQSHEVWIANFRAAIASGEIEDPATKPRPTIKQGEVEDALRPQRHTPHQRFGAPLSNRVGGDLQQTNLNGPGELPDCFPLPTVDDFFPFEDTDLLLLSVYTGAQLFALMTDAANALIADQGDIFDYIGFWLNYQPSFRMFGAAFHLGIVNDVTGIGRGLFDERATMGLIGENVQSYVMMWNLDFWTEPGFSGSNLTRLVLGEEFEHRFALFLPPLLDGRSLQIERGCGSQFHWNLRVDGQGSAMNLKEWVGDSPATKGGNCSSGLCFNSDIGGLFSYPDLYLMGYVTPQEMDSLSSELRYMDEGCSSPYNGTISTFSSADIIDSAGPRLPAFADAQKDFRAGWVFLHLPGVPPTTTELEKAAAILTQFTQDWYFSTLGRGTMNNTLRGVTSTRIIEPPVSDSLGDGLGSAGKSRYLSFDATGNDPARIARVTITGVVPGALVSQGGFLPDGFADLVGTELFVGEPQELCTLPSVGFGGACPISTITTAPLQCDSFETEWAALGVVHVHGELIVPGLTYAIDLSESPCPFRDPPVEFSEPLIIDNPAWGDVSGPFVSGVGVWSVPDGSADIAIDVVAMLASFKGSANAPVKPRVDLEGVDPNNRAKVDGVINISEIIRVIDAFKGKPYPFAPPAPPCGG